MISHKCFVSNFANTHENRQVLGTGFDKGIHLSYLPLPHVYEKLSIYLCIFKGSEVYFYSGDIMKLKDDIQEVKPTQFISVPRLYMRFYDAIQNKLNEA